MRENKPKNNVTITWAVWPITVTNDPLNLFITSKCITLPAKSPIWFGVITLKVTPENTALMAVLKSIGSKFSIKYFHFTDSNPQFTSIRAIAKAK